MVKIALIALAFILLAVNWSIIEKEQHLAHGKAVYFELAPVDPRSLMQGDYMRLNFKLSQDIRAALRKKQPSNTSALASGDYFVIARLDDRNIAQFSKLFDNAPLADDEIKIQFRVRNNQIKFATNAFFFQEGKAKKYEAAQYGQFRLNSNGEPLLTALYDKTLSRL